jgi:dTDP-4-amino-4,6-dideoxygalactose transaminase
VIPFANLAKQHARLRDELAPVVADVLASGEFVLGPQVARFEGAFARYCGAAHAIGVNSGTSALHLALLAAGTGPGDEVIVPAFSFAATAAAVGYCGATPVFVDIEPRTFAIDPARIDAAISARTRAIVPVHLYGHPAPMDAILAIARARGIRVVEDAAQAHGAAWLGRHAGTLGDAGCFSFYPSKNLGAAGEGGMVLTAHAEWAERIRALRNWGSDPRSPGTAGFNYRMEAMQAAILGVKLGHLDAWNETRRAHAATYDAALAGAGLAPRTVSPSVRHATHIYALRSADRDALRRELGKAGIETRLHYPVPLHRLEAWRRLGHRDGDFPQAERAAREVVSIPVHPELEPAEVERIAAALRSLAGGRVLDAQGAAATP